VATLFWGYNLIHKNGIDYKQDRDRELFSKTIAQERRIRITNLLRKFKREATPHIRKEATLFQGGISKLLSKPKILILGKKAPSRRIKL